FLSAYSAYRYKLNNFHDIRCRIAAFESREREKPSSGSGHSIYPLRDPKADQGAQQPTNRNNIQSRSRHKSR
ncbi:MAG TPA: hypothetical protein VK625_13005, partial [Flavitalea sp.]|nr:hypothetical protein [Flavitalea sp.]